MKKADSTGRRDPSKVLIHAWGPTAEVDYCLYDLAVGVLEVIQMLLKNRESEKVQVEVSLIVRVPFHFPDLVL